MSRIGTRRAGGTFGKLPTLDTFGVTDGGTSNVTTLTLSYTVGNGRDRLLLVCLSLRSGSETGYATGYTATYAGHSMTLLNNINAPSQNIVWYLVNPPAGTANIVTQWSNASAQEAIMGASSWFGVNRYRPIGSWTTATATATSISATVNSAPNQMVVDWLAKRANTGTTPTATVAAGQTELINRLNRVSGTVGTLGAMSYEIGASSSTLGWTFGGDGSSDASNTILIPLLPA